MRHFRLPAPLPAFLFSGVIAGAVLVGAVSMAGRLFAEEPTPAFTAARSTRKFFDGRVPVRLHAVEGAGHVPAVEATVLFARDGQVVLETGVVEGGTAQLDGLPSGPYSVIASGPQGFAAFATSVDESIDTEPHPGTVLSIGLVPPSDLPVLRQLINQGPESTSFVSTEVDSTLATNVAHNPLSLVHGDGFVLSPDGAIHGRIVSNPRGSGEEPIPYIGANVTFLQGGRVVAEAVTDPNGLFSVSGVQPGVTSLLVTAPNALLALSVGVHPPAESFARNRVLNEFNFVSFDERGAPQEASPIYESEMGLALDLLNEGQDESGGGAFGVASGNGAAGGGGGAGSDGSGLGEILGAAAVGLGIYAIAEDDDDNRRISPARP